MDISLIEPTTDPRWDAFVESHPDAGIFHTSGWLEALRRTYGYEPIAFASTTSKGAAQELVSAIPFCRVESLVTGRRLVSLPFSDYCQPLVGNEEELQKLLEAAENDARRNKLKYLEIRPLVSDEPRIGELTQLSRSNNVLVHKLDITRSEEDLLLSFHKNCVRKKLAPARLEKLRCEEGRSEELLRKFYGLLLLTRRRHQIPPQPREWFRNLIDCLGERLTIRVALRDHTPVAGVITLSFKSVMMDKYSCSDPDFNTFSGTVFLIWRAIQAARNEGLSEFDFGRSDYSTPGLIDFKDHWGARRCPVTYYRFPAPNPEKATNSRLAGTAKRLLSAFPDPMFRAVGGLLYRHVG